MGFDVFWYAWVRSLNLSYHLSVISKSKRASRPWPMEGSPTFFSLCKVERLMRKVSHNSCEVSRVMENLHSITVMAHPHSTIMDLLTPTPGLLHGARSF